MRQVAVAALMLISLPFAGASSTWDSAGWNSASWDSAGWDSAGWDSAGWDSAGWDSAGWHSASWDSAGWDSAGWHSAGWDSAGWDTATWDSAGWHSAGWDSAGWDSAGWDSAGWDSAGWDSTGWDGSDLTPPIPPWGLPAIRAPQAWARGIPASSASVCIVDSGIDATHPALANNVWAARSFIGGDTSDPVGHGTHVAGIVLSVAPNTRLAVAKVVGADGIGRTQDVTAGINWCVDTRADVVLLALSEDAPTKEFKAAVQRATKNAVVVASAGNTGPCTGCLSTPADKSRVLAVGAVDPTLATAAFSSSGPHLDIYAPGVAIASTIPGGHFAAASGTSQAAAFVAGAASLVIAHNPDMKDDAVVKAIQKSAAPLAGERVGLLDVDAALARAAR